MEALKAFDFGHLIAFILPGFVACRAVAYLLPTLRQAFEKVGAGGEGAAAPLVVLVLASSTVGLAMSVSRQQWLDPLFGFIYGCFKTDKQKRPPWRVDYTLILSSKEHTESYEKVVAQVYRYYQFITNLGLAVLVLAAVRFYQSLQTPAGANGPRLDATVLLGLAAAFLLLTAYQQFKGWCRVHNQISAAARQGQERAASGAKA